MPVDNFKYFDLGKTELSRTGCPNGRILTGIILHVGANERGLLPRRTLGAVLADDEDLRAKVFVAIPPKRSCRPGFDIRWRMRGMA
jgi:hypothetical protein